MRCIIYLLGVLGACVVHVDARGYGRALMGGIAAARGKFIVMGVADDSYDFTVLMPFLTKLHEGYYAAAAVFIGLQSIIFALLTKIFSISEGLLPTDSRLDKLFRYITLEVGLVSGSALTLCGLAGAQ